MFLGIRFIMVPLAIVLYQRINASRDAINVVGDCEKRQGKYTVQELRDLGDRAPDFRYML